MVDFNRGTGYMRPLPAATPRSGSVVVQYGPLVALLFLSFISADTWLFLLGTLVFAFFYMYFFSVDVPPVILFLFFFQWFFNQGQLVHALINGRKPISSMFLPGATVATVFCLGMIGTAAFFLGTLVFYRKIPRINFEMIRQNAARLNVDRLLALYLTTYPLFGIMAGVIWAFPGLAQPLVMALNFKWAIFALLFVAVFTHRRHKVTLFVIIAVEFILGFTSFWATFKDVVYVSFIMYWIFYFRERLILRWTLPVIIAVMIYIGSIWTIVKQDYRHFLNGGTGGQYSMVGREEALDKFADLVVSASEVDLEGGFDGLILRMSWIGAFNRVYNHVPSRVPYQDGSLWGAAVIRPFTPRLLLPGKTVLSDSQELNYYSGLNVDEKNTSISLSTIAGSYVDFGSWGMHVPLLLFGIFFGWIYKKVFDMSINTLLGYAMTIPLIFLVNINEQSINRMVSSLVLYILVAWFLCRFMQRPFLRFVTAHSGKK